MRRCALFDIWTVIYWYGFIFGYCFCI